LDCSLFCQTLVDVNYATGIVTRKEGEQSLRKGHQNDVPWDEKKRGGKSRFALGETRIFLRKGEENLTEKAS